MTAPNKLWHDDIRKPPDGSWRWARTNHEAIKILINYTIVEASLDHDLGAHDVDPASQGAVFIRGAAEDTGFDLVQAMIALRLVPAKVTIHSWNYAGAQRMRDALRAAAPDCEVTTFPYQVAS